MSERVAGVIGATGLVGECLLETLEQDGWDVVALSSTSSFSKAVSTDPCERQTPSGAGD